MAPAAQDFRSRALMVWDLWCFEELEENDCLINLFISEIMTDVFVEQPRLHWVCKEKHKNPTRIFRSEYEEKIQEKNMQYVFKIEFPAYFNMKL